MLTKNNVTPSLEIALSAQAKGRSVKPKPSTPLHTAVAGHPLTNMGIDMGMSEDAVVEAIVKASELKNKITGEHDHDNAVDTAVKPVVAGLRQQLHFIVSEVIPTLNIVQSGVTKRVETLQQNTGNQYNIIEVGLPNLVKNREFMNFVERHTGTRESDPMRERLPGMSLGAFTTAMIREILRSEYGTFGTDFLEWLAVVPDTTVARVYNVLFNDNRDTRLEYGTFTNVGDLATDLDHVLVALCLSVYYAKDINIPPNAGLTYAEYNNAIRRIVSATADLVITKVNYTATRISEGFMAAIVEPGSQASLFDLHLQKEVYNDFLAQGGDVTAILGYSISHSNIFDLRLKDLLTNQSTYLTKWAAYLHQAKLMFNNNFEVILRDSLVGALREYVRSKSTEDASWQGQKGDEAIDKFLSQLKAVPILTKDNWRHQSTLAICRALYEDTSAETIISKMAVLEEQAPDLDDPRQYASMALFEYLVDWTLGQVEAPNTTIGHAGKQSEIELGNSVITLACINELVYNVAKETLGQEASTNIGGNVQLTDRSSIPYIASIVKNRLNRLYGI